MDIAELHKAADLNKVKNNGADFLSSAFDSKYSKYHCWINCKAGIVISAYDDYMARYPKPGIWKYIGWTMDTSWPKKMNTGRVFYKGTGNRKSRKRFGL